MWPPYLDEHGDLYVDGGVLDNLPVAGVDAAEVSVVVASSVSRPHEPGSFRGGSIPSGGLEAIASKVRGQGRFPGLGAVIYKTAVVGSLSQFYAATDQADLVVQADLPGISINDYTEVESIARQGYEATMQSLETFDRLGNRFANT